LTAQIMSVDANKDVVRRFVTALNTGDLPALRETLADDLVWTWPGDLPFGGEYHGPDGFIGGLLGQILPLIEPGSLHAEVETLIAEGENVALVWDGKARNARGEPYQNHYCLIMELADGRIRRCREFTDTHRVEHVIIDPGRPAEARA